MKRILFHYILFSVFIAAASGSVLAQKTPKLPSKIGDALVLDFSAPFDRISIDTDEDFFNDRENVLLLVGTNTKILDAKGKPLTPEKIRSGMKTEIKLEASLDPTNLIAAQIKLKNESENSQTEVKGYLDKVSDDLGYIDGKTIVLMPNVSLTGNNDWKNKSFNKLIDIPLGSVMELKGTRREDGFIYITQGQVKPNLITTEEKNLIALVQKGLVLPPPDKPGAGVQIGSQSFKVVENLELNTYVTKVGYKVIPRYLKNLQDGDPNKLLFRFYILEDDSPNAVALPDGSVFIHTGMLRRLDNEAQLAIILGHEIAHVSAEHTRRQIESAQKRALWMGLAAAGASVVVGQELAGLVGQIGYGLLSNKFSRNLEDQADRIGLFYAYDAGYDIREGTKIWRKLIGNNYKDNSVGTFLYSDHPSLKSRLRNTKRELVVDYRKADFREVIDGRDKFMETVGVYFGWVKPKPKPQPVIVQNSPKTSVNKANSKKTAGRNAKTVKSKIPVKANDGFRGFFASFRKAVLSNDQAAVKNLMSANFEWALDGFITRDEAVKNMDQMKLWNGLRNAVMRTPVACKGAYCNNRSGYRTWSTAIYKVEIMFEKDGGGNWHWTAMLGD